MAALGKNLLEIVPNVSDAIQSDVESFKCSKAKLGHADLVANLEKVSREVEFNDRMAVAKITKPLEVSSFVGTEACSIGKTKILKLKVTLPTFSGKCRDFAVFKRDFQTIVAVADRSDVEIGALLKESVPSKWKYLLDKVELSNHKEMMSILTAKFGRARIIIDECTSEIRNMKVINSDSQFIAFVDHIEKVKRDLEQLNLLSDIANTTVIADLESKLPYGVKRDWIKLVSSKECAEMTPGEIFHKMLEFFEETKLQAEYHNTEIRITNSYGRASTKLGFVCGMEPSSKLVQPVREPPRACLVCKDGTTDLKAAMHSTGSCAVWQSLFLKEKEEKVNCVKCPFYGKETKHSTSECKKEKFKCHECLQENDHHTWFCTMPKS